MASAPPKLKPPPNGDEHRGDDIIISQFVFGAIATVVVFVRMWVRATMVRIVGWDDWLILLAWMITVVGFAFNCLMVQAGFGRHQFYLIKEPLNFLEGNKWQSLWPPTFIVAVMLTRISICLFLLRIFSVKTIWRWGLYLMIVFILITNIPTFIFIFIQCKPYQKTWNQKLPGRCWSTDITTKVGLYNGVVSVVIDWILASLPIVFLWDMQVSRKAKFGICILMSMGFFTGVTAIVRTVITKRVISQGRLADFSWISIDLRVWGELEILIGIIAACVPAVKPLYSRAATSLLSWSKGKSSGGYLDESEEQHRLHTIRPAGDPYDLNTGHSNKGNRMQFGKGGRRMGPEKANQHGYDGRIGTAISTDGDELQRLDSVSKPANVYRV